MDLLTLLTVAVLMGWLTALIMHTDEDVSLLDFAVGVLGAALALGCFAPALEIQITGEFGLTLSGTLLAALGATILLAVINLARFGTLRRDVRPHSDAALSESKHAS